MPHRNKRRARRPRPRKRKRRRSSAGPNHGNQVWAMLGGLSEKSGGQSWASGWSKGSGR